MVRFGGGENTHLNITPVSIAPERLLALNARLMLFFTGLSRTASEIAGEQIENTHKNIEQLQAMYELVFKASYILSSNMDLDDFGRLLDSTWKLKRTLSKKISTDTVDGIYKTAISNGALGGKLLGAGGGGFILFYVPPEKQAQVKNALGLLHVPFSFENCGSQVV